MEKYGVDETQDEKTAGDQKAGTCPSCGSKLRSVNTTGVLLCPKCGSKPFERNDNGAR